MARDPKGGNESGLGRMGVVQMQIFTKLPPVAAGYMQEQTATLYAEKITVVRREMQAGKPRPSLPKLAGQAVQVWFLMKDT